MKRLFTLTAALAAAVACADDPMRDPSRAVAPPIDRPQPTFVLFGTVRDDHGVVVAGAIAEIVYGPYAGRSSVSNAKGHFSFPGVAGVLSLRVYQDGFDRYLQTLTVTGDVAIEVTLFRAFPADTIRLGQTIQSVVRTGSEPCDPIRWDAMAPCRRFSFVAPTSGLLVIIISWSGDPELDATIVDSNNDYVATSTTGPGELATLAAAVQAKATYEIRVNSYYSDQDFLLRADLQSPVRR